MMKPATAKVTESNVLRAAGTSYKEKRWTDSGDFIETYSTASQTLSASSWENTSAVLIRRNG